MDTPQFTVQDFDEALSHFLDMHPSLRYDRKQAGRAVTCKIYDGIGELGFIRMGPGRGQWREVHLSAYSKAANASLGGPWWGFGSNMDPKRALDDRDRKFRTICTSFYAYFRAIHCRDKVKGQGTGFKLLDLSETPDRAGAQATTPDVRGGSKLRGKNIDTAVKVAKAQLIIERKGHKINQQAACDLAGTTPKTLRKYEDDPDVLDELERLRQDKDFLDEIGGI